MSNQETTSRRPVSQGKVWFNDAGALVLVRTLTSGQLILVFGMLSVEGECDTHYVSIMEMCGWGLMAGWVSCGGGMEGRASKPPPRFAFLEIFRTLKLVLHPDSPLPPDW